MSQGLEFHNEQCAKIKNAALKRPAFITGSVRYGVVTEDSDIDLIVQIASKRDLLNLVLAADVNLPGSAFDHANKQISLRFGKLNLVAVLGDDYYDAWLESTKQSLKLLERMREQAAPNEYIGGLKKEDYVPIFQDIFTRRGLEPR